LVEQARESGAKERLVVGDQDRDWPKSASRVCARPASEPADPDPAADETEVEANYRPRGFTRRSISGCRLTADC